MDTAPEGHRVLVGGWDAPNEIFPDPEFWWTVDEIVGGCPLFYYDATHWANIFVPDFSAIEGGKS
jgi:hypothetical protein